MKRMLITLTWFVLLGFAVSTSMAQEYGRYNNPSGGFYSTRESEARQRFLDDTVELRRSLVVKQAKFNALKAKTNPDPKLAGTLAKEIFEIQELLRKKAKAYEIKGVGGATSKGEPPEAQMRRGWWCW
jgi:hypothetical protein